MKISFTRIFAGFFLLINFSACLTSCAQQQEKKNTAASRQKPGATTGQVFEVELDKSFYMTGDAMDDLYITAAVKKGSVLPGTAIDLVKKTSGEKITGTVYKVTNSKHKDIAEGRAGEEVVLYLKLNNDKKFSLGYTGDQYSLVKSGTAVKPGAGNEATARPIVKIDGKPWEYAYVKAYHYTNPSGVTKARPNIMISFTKPNAALKTQKEEVLQVNIYTVKQQPFSVDQKDMDIAYVGMVNGKEVTYTNNNKDRALPGIVNITAYTVSGNSAIISGNIQAAAAEYFCKGCPPRKIDISIENLPVELYNN